MIKDAYNKEELIWNLTPFFNEGICDKCSVPFTHNRCKLCTFNFDEVIHDDFTVRILKANCMYGQMIGIGCI